MTFTRSTDYEAIRRVATEPRCYRRMASDTAPRREHFVVNDELEYIVASFDGATLAVFLLTGDEVHLCYAPQIWGSTVPILKAFLEWVWENTERTRLIGPVPGYNRLAIKLARAAGFEEFDVVRNAVQKRGRAFDLVLLEVRKPT